MPKEIAPVCHFPQITDNLDFFFILSLLWLDDA